MSAYNLIEIALQDSECLIDALKQMGYNPIVHQEAQNLTGYQGDKRKQKAHIIIPRSQVGAASNDVGFERIGDKFVLHLSQYDTHVFQVNQCKQLYAASKIKKAINNNSKYKLKSEEKDKGKIRVRVQLNVK